MVQSGDWIRISNPRHRVVYLRFEIPSSAYILRIRGTPWSEFELPKKESANIYCIARLYLLLLRNPGNKLPGPPAEWTQKAAAYIVKKEYRYYSPVMLLRQSDARIEAVINVALTNEPKTRNIQAIAAKAEYALVGHGKPVFPNGDPIDETT